MWCQLCHLLLLFPYLLFILSSVTSFRGDNWSDVQALDAKDKPVADTNVSGECKFNLTCFLLMLESVVICYGMGLIL
ncbi:hypothetical protein MtrunA17_Chr6g0483751 [Medicago truncatula]|uniref:Transmembrane protein, putative n=1 Tax=Medicago truncatula TaxID=3880 RepID=A0A072UD32_MEDTR|nr:transmembrane protein, putative [Medicago truncatula]RHN52739.1 hypothetical protein MtrunA17_Chr6g0483751 [Medicago truncatula]